MQGAKKHFTRVPISYDASRVHDGNPIAEFGH